MRKILAEIVLCVCAAQAWAGVIDNANTNNGACNQPCSSIQKFFTGLQGGEVVFVHAGWVGAGLTATISDDAGNTYTPVGSPRTVISTLGATVNVQLWVMVNQGNPSTVTLSTSGPTQPNWFDGIFIQVVAFTGVNWASPVDNASIATGSGSGTSLSINSGALGFSNEMMWGFFMFGDSVSPYVVKTGYTDVGPNEAIQLPMYSNLSNSPGYVESVTATSHTSAPWTGIVVGIQNGTPAGCPDANGYCYVRPGATGAGNGLNWTDAFTDLPPVLTRGVTYLLAAGNYKPHTFGDADSGTTPITIQSATVGNHGTSTGWLNGYAGQSVFKCSAACNSIWLFNSDYYTINGAIRQRSTPENPYADWSAVSSYGIMVDDSNGDLGQNSAVFGGTGFAGAPCGSPSICNANGIYVHDLTFSYVYVRGFYTTVDANMDTAYTFQGGSYNILFDHYGIGGAGIPFFLRGNHTCISGCSSGGTYYFGTGDNITMQYGFVTHNFVDEAGGLHSEFCSCSEGLTNFTIRWNWIQDIVGTAVYAQAGSDTSNNGPVAIYGNVWTQDDTTHCQVGGGLWGAQGEVYNEPVYFFNNTIAINGYPACPGQDEDGWGYGAQPTTYQNVYWQNNLWYEGDNSNLNGFSFINTCTSCTFAGSTANSVTWSYQAYFASPNSAAADTDANKQTSASNPFVNLSTYNLNLSSDTAPGIGTNSILIGNATDMLGTARGANGVWDRGAFQLPAVAPPSGSSLVRGGASSGVGLH